MKVTGRLKLALAIAAAILLALLVIGPMVLGDYLKSCAVTIGNATHLDYEVNESECEAAGGVFSIGRDVVEGKRSPSAHR